MGVEEVNSRPSFHEIYMEMAFALCRKSLDPRTKHGCMVVAEDYTPLSFGYNSPPRGCDDSKIPLEAPAKYKFMAHAERNAINNAAKKGACLEGSVFYITGFPCPECFQSIVNAGAKKIIYGPIGSHMIAEEDVQAVDIMNTRKDGSKTIELVKFQDLVGCSDSPEKAMQKIRNGQNAVWDYICLKVPPSPLYNVAKEFPNG